MGDSSLTRKAVTQMAQVFGEYTFTHILAEGGMGIILEAQHRLIGRKVALKIVSPKYAAREGFSPGLIDVFMHEARVLGAIDHPNVIALYDAGVVGQCPYMAMRLVGGGDLATHLLHHGVPRDELTLRIMRDCAAGLRAVHAAGYINRDIKPANILIDGDGTARLSDFGLAIRKGERQSTERIAGTPSYLAPEQITGGAIDERTDIYALGASMFFAATGKPPFSGASPEEIIIAVRDAVNQPTARHHRANIDPKLSTIIRKCMAIKPERRYKDAGEIEHDCRSVIDGGEPEYAQIGAKRRKSTFLGSILNKTRVALA